MSCPAFHGHLDTLVGCGVIVVELVVIWALVQTMFFVTCVVSFSPGFPDGLLAPEALPPVGGPPLGFGLAVVGL